MKTTNWKKQIIKKVHRLLLTGAAVLFIINYACTTEVQRQAEKLWDKETTQSQADLPQNKIVVIIPGMNDSPYKKAYREIGGYFQDQGITPLYLFIDWKKFRFKDLPTAGLGKIEQLLSPYPDCQIYLFGYSMGGAIALNYAARGGISKIILCSPSPVFEKEIRSQPILVQAAIGLFLKGSFEGLEYPEFKEPEKIIFLYGEHDHFLINRKIIANRRDFFQGSQTIIIRNGHHNIESTAYMQAVKSVIGELDFE